MKDKCNGFEHSKVRSGLQEITKQTYITARTYLQQNNTQKIYCQDYTVGQPEHWDLTLEPIP